MIQDPGGSGTETLQDALLLPLTTLLLVKNIAIASNTNGLYQMREGSHNYS